MTPSQLDREEQIRQLLAYLEQHRAQYDLSALRKQLIDAGYSNTLEDEPLRRIDGGAASPSGPGPRLIGCLLSLLNLALLALVVYGVGVVTSNGYALLLAALGVLGVELAAAGALWRLPGQERASRLLLWTVIWTVAGLLGLAALVALLFGLCLALYSTQI
jgi:hypothetical protein